MINHVLGQVRHELLWSTFYDSYQQTQHVNFTCECGAWRMPWKLDPIEAFRGRVLDLPGRSIGVEVLKAGINAGREYQCHLDKAQVDVILWGGGVLP